MKNLKKNLESIEKFEAVNQEELNLIKGGLEEAAAGDSTKNDSNTQDSKKHDHFGPPSKPAL
ncbi:hypothetical protein CLV51_10527 [Chitinophaga niastensis]|uniref:Uncharacterized protein n=1 Tax=Chitinophaga niastensis TaxID=536980 RepID=A0A2P8HEN3_CHINA|nr:hypothetical protein [Chitinophaga niastensis]PSL44655.1 hypothetical protein CLV51_10527 [Chitinophaga niastensis]